MSRNKSTVARSKSELTEKAKETVGQLAASEKPEPPAPAPTSALPCGELDAASEGDSAGLGTNLVVFVPDSREGLEMGIHISVIPRRYIVCSALRESRFPLPSRHPFGWA